MVRYAMPWPVGGQHRQTDGRTDTDRYVCMYVAGCVCAYYIQVYRNISTMMQNKGVYLSVPSSCHFALTDTGNKVLFDDNQK